MLFPTSIRSRLLILILAPLSIASFLGIGWQYIKSEQLAEAVFDQKLSIMALAIYRDLLATNGESLSPSTKALFEEASDSQFFYHVRGPDGGFITGYSPPPLRPININISLNSPTVFKASHRGVPVQVVQLKQSAKIDELEGLVLVSVWQDFEQRQKLATHLATQSALTALLLFCTVFLAVFFGISVGLQPLSSVEQAIGARSSSDLRPIRRSVPIEVQYIVQRLNKLFEEVTKEQSSRNRFISNAAHQLRNPIAAIHSLSEVTQNSHNLDEAKKRNNEVIKACHALTRLTEQLLSYERLKNITIQKETIEFDKYIAEILSTYANKVVSSKIKLSFAGNSGKNSVTIDTFLIEQALLNILDNALAHGGKKLKNISVSTRKAGANIYLSVCNDGEPIPKTSQQHIFKRFEQGQNKLDQDQIGTGLGLAILKEICALHDVGISLSSTNKRTCFKLRFIQ